ncbi:MAG: helix-turn-helix transcriptional regulator [Bacillota bacterium]|nr:helix-turn-helix transcriptional regulator [Bacillota bacterium]
MLFCEKLDKLLTALGRSNAELARASSLDASLISRFRQGRRVPSVGSAQLHKLCDGLEALLAASPDSAKLLQTCAGGSVQLKEWLLAEDSGLRPRRQRQDAAEAWQSAIPAEFAARLDMLMRRLGLSNARMGEYLNVDASLISRWRSGLRQPAQDGALAAEAARLLAARIERHPQAEQLREQLGASGGEDLAALILGGRKAGGTAAAAMRGRELLKAIGSALLTETQPYQHTLNSIAQGRGETLGGQSFYGLDGLRQAMITSIAQFAAASPGKPAYIYAGIADSVLYADRTFEDKMGALCAAAQRQGLQMTVIHCGRSMKQDLPQLLRRWLPFYSGGLVEPYYLQLDERTLTAPLMLFGDSAVISGSGGAEGEDGFYQYCHGERLRQAAYSQFKLLRGQAVRLLEIYGAARPEAYLRALDEHGRDSGDSYALRDTLPLAALSTQQLTEMLERLERDYEVKARVLNYHMQMREQLYHKLRAGQMTETLYIADREHLYADIPGVICEQRLYCTAAEAQAQLSFLRETAARNQNYHLNLLEQAPPFPGLQFELRGQRLLLRNDQRRIALGLDDGELAAAVRQYCE